MKPWTPIILLLLCMHGYAQESALDSLDRLIRNAKSDTAKINLSVSKVSTYIELNLDSAVSLGSRTVESAVRINYPKGEGDARQRLATALCFKGDYVAAGRNLVIAEQIFRDTKDSLGLCNTYSAYGILYGMQSKYDTAITFFKRSIEIGERNKYQKLLASIYQNISISYQMQSDFAQALEHLQRAQIKAEELNDIKTQSYIALNMGITYNTSGDSARAEEKMLDAIKLSKNAGTKNVELYSYSNLASLYIETGKYSKAYDYALKAVALSDELADMGIKASSLAKAASALGYQNRFAEAEALARKGITIADSAHQPINSFQAYCALGVLLTKQQKFRDAIIYLEKGFEFIRDAALYDANTAEGYSNLSISYEKTGDHKKALEAYKKSAEIYDSVSSRENVRRTTEMSLKYEFQKKQQAAEAAQQQKNIITESRQSALIFGLLLTLIIAAIIFYAFRNKQKANKLLEKQNEEIQRTLSELKAAQEQLIQSEKMASLGELTAGIAHEIQNPLNFVKNFSEVNMELISDLKQEWNKPGSENTQEALLNDMEQNLEKIIHHGKRADAIVKSMLQHSRSSTGQKEFTDINVLADEYLRLSYHGLRAKDKTFNVSIKTDYDQQIGKINVIPQDIGRVLLNLYTNAFYSATEKKNSGAGNGEGYEPVVSVTTKKLRDKVEIRISDNGAGIPQKVKDKIFQPFFTTKPTGKGTGLGLSLSYDIVTKSHGGQIMVETKEGEFATFIVQLPV